MSTKPDKIIRIEPFGCDLNIFGSRKDFKAFLKEHKAPGIPNIPKNAPAFFYRGLCKGYRLWCILFPDEISIDVVHECSHVIDQLFKDVGVPPGLESTELRAYLMGKLVDDICVFLKGEDG